MLRYVQVVSPPRAKRLLTRPLLPSCSGMASTVPGLIGRSVAGHTLDPDVVSICVFLASRPARNTSGPRATAWGPGSALAFRSAEQSVYSPQRGFDWRLHASAIPDHGSSVAHWVLWLFLFHDFTNREEGRVRGRIHDLEWIDRLRDVRSQHDGNLGLGGFDLRRSQLWLQIRAVRRHPLWILGRVDDPLRVSIWASLQGDRPGSAYAGGNHARASRTLQPDDSGSVECAGQRHQPDGELHCGRCAGIHAVAPQLHAGRADRCFWRAFLHLVVRFPRIGTDRLRPVGRHDPRCGADHSLPILYAWRD